VLSAAVPRFADLTGRVAAGDTYRNLTLRGGTYDASALTLANLGAGGHHLVIGTMGAGIGATPMYLVSIADVTVEGFKVVGAPVTGVSNTQLFAVAIATSVASSSAQQRIDWRVALGGSASPRSW
jgi:hypothetical protein